MKRFLTLLVVFATAILWGMGVNAKDDITKVKAGSLKTKGIWVSCFEFEEIGLKDKTEWEFRANAEKIFDTIKANGLNTVYFHVRAFDDAIYPSQVTGWSEYIWTGTTSPAYDPLEILVSIAHKKGLKIHAWMNPYRVTSGKILNPAKEETITRIVTQVKEIITNYKVDGIHFDDYFYPTANKKYKKLTVQQKKDNVNKMVRQVYQTVKTKKKSLKFGISPTGNIENCEKMGADVKTWMSQSGYVDYIIPQIYWSDNYILQGKKVPMFTERFVAWQEINAADIPMYIGLGLYRTAMEDVSDKGWSKKNNNISTQIRQIKSGNAEGFVLFTYRDLLRDTAQKELRNYYKEIGSMKLSKKKKTLRVGKKFTLKVKWKPTAFLAKVKWKSSNKKIAKVTKNGVVKGRKKGKVRIYATYGKWKKSCVVKVKKKKKGKK